MARLLSAANSDHERDWAEIVFYLVFAIGGHSLDRVIPDTGKPVVPGSIGERRRRTHTGVSREDYFALIRDRLTGLVSSGLREDVLVRSLRDEITTKVKSGVDTTQANVNRARTRQQLDRIAEDPDELAAYREQLAKRDANSASLTDAEVIERLREMSERMGPISKEAEVGG